MLSNKKPDYFPEAQYIQIPKSYVSKKSGLKAAKRVFKLFVLCALLPSILLVVPLYLRFRVYIEQIYPLAVTDMRIIDNKISTTWCQKQLIMSNTTFNAYVIANEPQISKNYENVEMRRSMVLKDGVKEYWGFYLLKGSSFKVSACVRWQGASLIVIEGHRHLKECAYMGDNSSEEKEDSMSSEEDHNVTFIDQMTKFSSGIVVNRVDNSKLPNESPSERAETVHPLNSVAGLNGKTKNHLKYAEDLYRKELNKGPKNESTTVSPERELAQIMDKLKTMKSQGAAVLQKVENSSSKEENNKSVDMINKIYDVISQQILTNNRSKTVKKNENGSSIDYDTEFRKLKNQILFYRSKILNFNLDNETNTGQEVFDEESRKDIHGSVHHKKDGDRSKSEYWSSFSSSEEILLNCSGLLASLPLIPHNSCEQKFADNHLDGIASVNSVSYEVQKSGYYFFIFNNENEVQENFIHAHFELKKAVYDTSEAVVSCKNETKECALPLTFWSHERTIVALPRPADDSQWNEEYVFISKCEPRSTLYLICILLIPVCILLFAFS